MSTIYPLMLRNQGDSAGKVRWLFLILGLLGVIGVSLAIENAAAGVPGDEILSPFPLVNLAIFGGLLAISLYAFFALGPGAESCEWSSDGFTFHYKRGRLLTFLWGSRSMQIRLTQITNPERTTYTISTTIPWATPLTELLYRLIIDEAKRRGFSVDAQTSGVSWDLRVDTRIRAPRPE